MGAACIHQGGNFSRIGRVFFFHPDKKAAGSPQERAWSLLRSVDVRARACGASCSDRQHILGVQSVGVVGRGGLPGSPGIQVSVP